MTPYLSLFFYLTLLPFLFPFPSAGLVEQHPTQTAERVQKSLRSRDTCFPAACPGARELPELPVSPSLLPLCIFLQKRGNLLQSVARRIAAISMLPWTCISLCLPLPSDNSQAVAPDLVFSNCTFLQAPAARNMFLVPTCEFNGALAFLMRNSGLQGGTVTLCTHVSQQQLQRGELGYPCPPTAKVCMCRWWRIGVMPAHGDLRLASSYRHGARQRGRQQGSRPAPPELLSWWHPKFLLTPLVLHPP